MKFQSSSAGPALLRSLFVATTAVVVVYAQDCSLQTDNPFGCAGCVVANNCAWTWPSPDRFENGTCVNSCNRTFATAANSVGGNIFDHTVTSDSDTDADVLCRQFPPADAGVVLRVEDVCRNPAPAQFEGEGFGEVAQPNSTMMPTNSSDSTTSNGASGEVTPPTTGGSGMTPVDNNNNLEQMCAAVATMGNASCTACLDAGCAWREDSQQCAVQCLLAEGRDSCVSQAAFPNTTLTTEQMCTYQPNFCTVTITDTNIIMIPPMDNTTVVAENNSTTANDTSTVSTSATRQSIEDAPTAGGTCTSCLRTGCAYSQNYANGPALCLGKCTEADPSCIPHYVPAANSSPPDFSTLCEEFLNTLPTASNVSAEGSVTRPDTTDPPANVTDAPVPTPAPVIPCDTPEDCDPAPGTFCSSATSTCLPLNCSNWIAGTPAGAEYYSAVPCTGENFENAFCGYDGVCREYTCDSWYQFGPVAFTGYDPENPVELVCEDWEDGPAEEANSVVFGCRTYTPGNRAPRARTWVHFFNQKCTASPRSGSEFECYNNRDNEQFRDFVTEVAQLSPESCDREIYAGIIEQPIFWYNIVMRQVLKGNTTDYLDGRDNTRNSASFDPSEADNTMFAVLTTDEIAEQSFGPTDPPEEDNDNSGATRSVAGVLTAVVWSTVVATMLQFFSV